MKNKEKCYLDGCTKDHHDAVTHVERDNEKLWFCSEGHKNQFLMQQENRRLRRLHASAFLQVKRR